MNETDEWIDATYKELEKKIAKQEDEFILFFLMGYLTEFDTDEQSVKTTDRNYGKVNQIGKRFDEAYDLFIIPFLIWYGNKLLEAGKSRLEYFKEQGAAVKDSDIAYLSTAIGLKGKSVIAGSFLHNLGKMGEMRQRLQDKLIQAISSGQKMNVMLRNIKPIFKSTTKTKSWLSKYYLKFAYQPIMQTLNSVGYKLALQYGFDSFVYAGGLVEKSRDFCIERNGNEYTIEEGKKWNNLDWSGKIEGVDFFIALGGHRCLHFLEYYKDEETNK